MAEDVGGGRRRRGRRASTVGASLRMLTLDSILYLIILTHHTAHAQTDGSGDDCQAVENSILYNTTSFTEQIQASSSDRSLSISVDLELNPFFAADNKYETLLFHAGGYWTSSSSNKDYFAAILKSSGQNGFLVEAVNTVYTIKARVSSRFSPGPVQESDFARAAELLKVKESDIGFVAIGQFDDYNAMDCSGHTYQSVLYGVYGSNNPRFFVSVHISAVDKDTASDQSAFLGYRDEDKTNPQTLLFDFKAGAQQSAAVTTDNAAIQSQLYKYNCRVFTESATGQTEPFDKCPGSWSQDLAASGFSRFVNEGALAKLSAKYCQVDNENHVCCYNGEADGDTFKLNTGFTYNNLDEFDVYRSCREGGLLKSFTELRPFTESDYDPPENGQSYGDISVTTFDKEQYFFNLVGYYRMVSTVDSSLAIDIRLEAVNPQAVGGTGSYISGMAMQGLGKSTVVCQIKDRLLELMIVRSSGATTLQDNDFDSDRVYFDGEVEITQHPFIGPSGTVLWTWYIVEYIDRDYTVWCAVFSPTVNPAYMIVLASLGDSFKGNIVSGLLGKFDEDPSNDFLDRNGNTISTESSEAEISAFGATWKVSPTETVYPEEAGGPRTDDDFGVDTHVVLYCDQAIAESSLDFSQCFGGPECECALATAGPETAEEVRIVAEAFNNFSRALETPLPVVNGSDLILARVGEEIVLTYFAQGPGKVMLDSSDAQLSISNLPVGATFDAASGLFRWTPSATAQASSESLRVDVEKPDTGIPGIGVSVFIRVCGAVDGQGTCDYTTSLDGLSLDRPYIYVASVCEVGWVGDFCQTDQSGCDVDDCLDDASCTDATPAQQQIDGLLYTCSACAEGFMLDADSQCIDVNECTTDNQCNQPANCINTFGSFTCSCDAGYILINETHCEDIDECTDLTSNCPQTCDNMPGSFECQCENGYLYSAVDNECSPDLTTISACFNAGCDEDSTICVVSQNNPSCLCRDGFMEGTSNTTCIDIDECLNMTDRCREFSTCENDIPGYTCSCADGFTTDADGRGCTPCPAGRYGTECSMTCNCNEDNCNATIGCEACDTGFEGVLCDDIDECAASRPNPCGNFTTCVNNEGSFTCPCITDYILNIFNGQCEPIDQCNEDPCEQGQCIQVVTQYHCACYGGFEGRNCEIEIDECLIAPGICLNGATCVDRVNAYECICPDSYTGRRCEFQILPPTTTQPLPLAAYEGSFITNCEVPDDPGSSEFAGFKESLESAISEVIIDQLEVAIAVVEITDTNAEDQSLAFQLLAPVEANLTNVDILNAIGRSFDTTFGTAIDLVCPDNVTELEIIPGSINVGGEMLEEDFRPLPVILGTVLGVLFLILFTIAVAVCARRAYNAQVIVRTKPLGGVGFNGFAQAAGAMRWLPRGVVNAGALANIRRRERPIDNPWAPDLYDLETDEVTWDAWRGADNAYYGRSTSRPAQIPIQRGAVGAMGAAQGRGMFFRDIASGNFARPLPPLPSGATQNLPAGGTGRIQRPRMQLPRFNFTRPNVSFPNVNLPRIGRPNFRQMAGWLPNMPWSQGRRTAVSPEPVYGTTPVRGCPVSALTPSSPVYAASPTAVTSPMMLLNQGVHLQPAQQGVQYSWQSTGI